MANSFAFKKVYIDVQSRYLGSLGFANLDRQFAGFVSKQKAGVLAARAMADANIVAADRAGLAWTRAKDKQALAAKRTADLELRYASEVTNGSVAAADRIFWQWKSMYDKLPILAAESARKQAAAQDAQVAASAAKARAATLSRTAAVSGAFSLAGKATMGVGVAGAVGGYELIKRGMDWQTFVSQNQANAQISNRESRHYQALAFRVAQQTGANPNDVFMSLRYGAEMNLAPRQNRRYLNAALSLGLPTGGSGAIGPSLQAIAMVGKNFPQYANNPKAIANMLLATSQHAARGTNVSDIVSNLPQLLVMAGHIGGPKALPDALAMFDALGQAGLPTDEIATQGLNFLKVLTAGTARKGSLTYKTLAALKSQHGINLFPDFSQQGLQSKGISGVVTDIRDAHLSQKTLLTLFPNMRGVMAAMGLTGNQYKNYEHIAPLLQNAPNANPMAANMARYMGLSSVQTAKLEQRLKVLSITLGTQLLPAFNELLKDDVVPLVREFAKFSEKNRGLIADFVKLSPWVIGIGASLKLAAAGTRILTPLIAGLGAKAAITSGEVAGVSAASEGLTVTGLAAPLAGLAAMAAAFLLIKDNATKASNQIDKFAGNRKQPAGRGSPTVGQLAIGALFPWLELPGMPLNNNVTYVKNHLPGGSTNSSTAMPPAGVFPATHMIGHFPRWVGGVNGVPFGGSSFGNYAAKPDIAGANRIVTGPAAPWTRHLLGVSSSAVIMDTDFGNNGKKSSQPIRLPGSKKDPWIFLRYVQDPTNTSGNGGIASLWRDPMGNTVMYWHMNPHRLSCRAGQLYHGGDTPMWSWEEDGFWHMCIVTDPQGRKDLTVLTNPKYDAIYDKWRKTTGGALPTKLFGSVGTGGSGAAKPSNLPGTEGKVWGTITSAAARTKNVSPYVLAGIGFAESSGNVTTGDVNGLGFGTFGASKNWGTDAKGQANGAVNMLQSFYNWTGTAQGQASMQAHMDVLKAHGYTNTKDGKTRLFVALASYVNGQGAWWKDYGPNTGPRYATNVLQHAASYQKSAGGSGSGSGSGSKGSGVNVNLSGSNGPHTPYQWSQWWAQKGSTLSGNINSMVGTYWPNANMRNPNATQRALITPFLRTYFKDEYESQVSFARSEYKNRPDLLTKALAQLTRTYKHDLAHPFGAFFPATNSGSVSNRVSPVQAVGSNRQLAVAEEHLKVEKALLVEARKTNKNLSQRDRKLEQEIRKLVQYINHHGGHATFDDGSGIVTVGPAGG